MLESLTLLLICQLTGEVVVRFLDIPLPGPVLGMVLLFAGLLIRRGVPKPLQDTAGGLLSHLSLLFVPAGVGVMLHVTRIQDAWLAIGASLVLSTLIAVGVTAGTMILFGRLSGTRDSDGEDR
ncbi:MAG: CidA/LrgA family protein [Alphaproteobacteria bacterium]|nr:CidA/LrgA family protein [Alphaproteobacteria bacterium]